MSVDRPQPPEESINAKLSSICQSKRTHSVFKKTSGHEAQQDINNTCFQKIQNKEKPFAETSNDIELNIQCWSCLIVSMTFLQFCAL